MSDFGKAIQTLRKRKTHASGTGGFPERFGSGGFEMGKQSFSARSRYGAEDDGNFRSIVGRIQRALQ